jgi:hypothetical protein
MDANKGNAMTATFTKNHGFAGRSRWMAEWKNAEGKTMTCWAATKKAAKAHAEFMMSLEK